MERKFPWNFRKSYPKIVMFPKSWRTIQPKLPGIPGRKSIGTAILSQNVSIIWIYLARLPSFPKIQENTPLENQNVWSNGLCFQCSHLPDLHFKLHTIMICATAYCVSTGLSQPCRPCIQTHESDPVCPSCGCRCFVCVIHFHVRRNHPILQSCSVFDPHPWRILHQWHHSTVF